MNATRPAFAALCLLLAAASARAGVIDPAMMAPIHQFVDAFNDGDEKTAGEVFLPNAPITDAIVPFHWSSFESWYRDYLLDSKRRHITDEQITLKAPTASLVQGVTAYMVVPSTLTANANGRDGAEDGAFTFTLIKTPAGWRIQSWTWIGRRYWK